MLIALSPFTPKPSADFPHEIIVVGFLVLLVSLLKAWYDES